YVACRVPCAGNDVHVFAGSVETSGIAGGRVVIGYSFTAEVKVLRFDQPRHGEWRAFEGSLGARGGKGPERLIGRHREVPQRILGLHPVVVEGAAGQAAQGLGVGGEQRGDARRGPPVGGRRPVLQLGVRGLIGGPGDRGRTGGGPRRRHGGNGGRCGSPRRHQCADHAVALAQNIDLAIATQGETDVGAAATVRNAVRVVAVSGVGFAWKR